MPPKRAVSSKRKASASDDEGTRLPKKSKVNKALTGSSQADTNERAPNGQRTNKGFSAEITFPSRIDNTIRIATCNICGLAASSKKASLESRDYCQGYDTTLGISSLRCS